jgi:hypothetical protein
MSADDLLPMFIYVVIHADVPCMHQCIYFMDNFASSLERMTEFGYCLATLQGILMTRVL